MAFAIFEGETGEEIEINQLNNINNMNGFKILNPFVYEPILSSYRRMILSDSQTLISKKLRSAL
jgi:hypothetical protein